MSFEPSQTQIEILRAVARWERGVNFEMLRNGEYVPCGKQAYTPVRGSLIFVELSNTEDASEDLSELCRRGFMSCGELDTPSIAPFRYKTANGATVTITRSGEHPNRWELRREDGYIVPCLGGDEHSYSLEPSGYAVLDEFEDVEAEPPGKRRATVEGKSRLHPTAQRCADYITKHPGCSAAEIAAECKTSEDNFRKIVSRKLIPLGFNNDRSSGYFPPEST